MPTLPAEFADLEPFADWALPSERERYAKRLASTMDELQAFYDAAFPRLEAGAASTSSSARLDDLPEEAKHLLWLCYSLVNVSFPVEVWRQPRVPDSGASAIDVVRRTRDLIVLIVGPADACRVDQANRGIGHGVERSRGPRHRWWVGDGARHRPPPRR